MNYLADDLLQQLEARPARWLVTGAAGFIGSSLVECLLRAGQRVIGLDNFATGHRRNLTDAEAGAGVASRQFTFVEGDICDRALCRDIVGGVDHILHQAALGSVPRSMAEPLASHDVNVTGFVNLLDAARIARVERFVYAASSSTYGDSAELPKREDCIGDPLSPYAATKLIDEIYAAVYARSYGIHATGLRYFNVFGPRQDPDGAYAAVIPKWVKQMSLDQEVVINGDGETSRDFCFVANAVQANLRAALAPDDVQGEVYNVAVGGRTSLNQLFGLIRDGLSEHQVHYRRQPHHSDFRPGDARHSQADISKAEAKLGFQPTHDVAAGLRVALPWYLERFAADAADVS